MNDKRKMNMALIAVVSRLGTALGVALDDLKGAAENMQSGKAVPHAVQMKEVPPAVQHNEMPKR